METIPYFQHRPGLGAEAAERNNQACWMDLPGGLAVAAAAPAVWVGMGSRGRETMVETEEVDHLMVVVVAAVLAVLVGIF